MEISIEGLDDLQEFLEELPDKVERVILPEALREGAEAVLDAARQAAPKRTGNLAASLHLEEIEGGYAIVADAPYANCVNDGTRKMKAEPFLDEAVEIAGPTVFELVDQRLDDVLE